MTTPAPHAPDPYPLVLEGRLDPGLSRWLWLVKWVLAVPHYVVLVLGTTPRTLTWRTRRTCPAGWSS